MDLSEYKKGGKVKRKKVTKQKQKQKQTVKQTVTVKIGSDVLKKQRAARSKPQSKREASKTSVSVSSTPTQHDETQYAALRKQLSELQKSKSVTAKEEAKQLSDVRQKQQETYTEQLKPRMAEQESQPTSKPNSKLKKVMEQKILEQKLMKYAPIPIQEKPVMSEQSSQTTALEERMRQELERLKEASSKTERERAIRASIQNAFQQPYPEQPIQQQSPQQQSPQPERRPVGRPKMNETAEERRIRYAEIAKQKRILEKERIADAYAKQIERRKQEAIRENELAQMQAEKQKQRELESKLKDDKRLDKEERKALKLEMKNIMKEVGLEEESTQKEILKFHKEIGLPKSKSNPRKIIIVDKAGTPVTSQQEYEAALGGGAAAAAAAEEGDY